MTIQFPLFISVRRELYCQICIPKNTFSNARPHDNDTTFSLAVWLPMSCFVYNMPLLSARTSIQWFGVTRNYLLLCRAYRCGKWVNAAMFRENDVLIAGAAYTQLFPWIVTAVLWAVLLEQRTLASVTLVTCTIFCWCLWHRWKQMIVWRVSLPDTAQPSRNLWNLIRWCRHWSFQVR